MSLDNPDIKIVLDLETTGLDYKREKIIEFAGVKLVDNVITEELEMLINPQQEIRQSSIEIHHITPEMVEDAPTIAEIMPQILDFIGDYPIVAHNAIFDHSFLNQAKKELYGEELKNEAIDTFQMYKEVFPEEPSHGLEALTNRFNVELVNHHRAMADAKSLAYVYPHLRDFYNKKYEWQLSQMNNIEYLFERYLRLQGTIHTLQAEMGDLKSIFKVYFQENGKDVTSTTGEVLTCHSRLNYSYDNQQLKSIITEAELQDKGLKVNTGYIERLIKSSSTDEELRQKLMECRNDLRETQAISVVKPEKTHITDKH